MFKLKLSKKYLNSSKQTTPAPQLAISYTSKEKIHNEEQVMREEEDAKVRSAMMCKSCGV